MIFYFSGTGNSKWVADTLGGLLGTEVLSFSVCLFAEPPRLSFKLPDGEPLGFVFPVHAWGPPELVLKLIERLDLKNPSAPYCFAVVTCGEEVGKTFKVLRKALGFRGIPLEAAFSLLMPNNYVLGSTLYTEEKVRELLIQAKERVPEIAAAIGAEKRAVYDVQEGSMAGLKTAVIYPLYKRHGIRPHKYIALDTCTGCGICVKACMTHNITLKEGLKGDKPKWGRNCTGCLACINACPVEAIQYGKATTGRGRYWFKDIL